MNDLVFLSWNEAHSMHSMQMRAAVRRPLTVEFGHPRSILPQRPDFGKLGAAF